MGLGAWGLGLGAWGLGLGVWGLGFGVWGLGFGVWGLGFGVYGLKQDSSLSERCRGFPLLFVLSGFVIPQETRLARVKKESLAPTLSPKP